LKQTRERVLVLEFGGAVGTLAALGEKGEQVAQALAEELGLEVPDVPWHSHRDRVAEAACTLGLCAGTLGKIARDLSLHMQTEVSELFEPVSEGRGASSSMPHKQNPVASAIVLAAATRIPGLVGTMLSAMIQEDERGLGTWHAEWETLPEIFRLTAGALNQLATIVPRLKIDPARMLENLEASRGLVFSEAVAVALGRQVGRSQAQAWVEQASRRVKQSGRHLREVLEQDPEVAKRLTPADLDRLFAPENYLGAASGFVDRVVARSRSKS
jgi:3-carboxy-cis,cis-muconate cycloisomerase